MNQEETRTLVSTTINGSSALSGMGNVYYENQIATDKTATWFRVSIVFGTPVADVLGGSTQTNVLYVQVFYGEDSGVIKRNQAVDTLNELLQFKTLSNSNGSLQFRGGNDVVVGKRDEDYIQSNYSISFINRSNIT